MGILMCLKVRNMHSLIQKLFDISAKAVNQCNEVDFCILFASCSTQLSNATRKNILRKHKSDPQKQANAEKLRSNYANMEPSLKSQRLSGMRFYSQTQYNSLDVAEKEKRLLNMRKNSQTWYDPLSPEEKEKRLLDMCANSQTWYNSLNAEEKEKRLLDMVLTVKHGTTH